MNLYIVIGYVDYEGGVVQGVYSTRIQAKAAEERMEDDYFDSIAIFKIEIDKDEDINV